MVFATQVADANNMQHNHPDYAQPTQEVEGVVSGFHAHKGTKRLGIKD